MAELIDQINKTIRDVQDFPKKGIVFKDITPILKDAELSQKIIDELSNILPEDVTHVVGIESRGFLFGYPLAIKLGLPFLTKFIGI